MAKYTLPTATENILGGVKIGNGIDVTQDGVISIPCPILTPPNIFSVATGNVNFAILIPPF